MKNKKLAFFEKCVSKYQRLLNLRHWQIHVYESASITERGVRATTFWGDINEGGQIASICIGEEWINDRETTLFEIERTAFHECCELMLCRLRYLAQNTDYTRTDREVIAETHSIIRTLENNFLPYLIKFQKS